VTPQQHTSWESYLNEQLGGQGLYWQNLGFVKCLNGDLRVIIAENQPIIDMTIADMSDRFSQAIERRLTV
jgi:phosphoribosylformylglycinamidine synthase